MCSKVRQLVGDRGGPHPSQHGQKWPSVANETSHNPLWFAPSPQRALCGAWGLKPLRRHCQPSRV